MIKKTFPSLLRIYESFELHCFLFAFFSPANQVLVLQQQQQQHRGMANLKVIALRLKSVKNIQKITASMKMVSAAKYARAEKDLKAARYNTCLLYTSDAADE